MERRLRNLSAVYRGGDSDEITRCSDYLYWAFRVTPRHAREQDANLQGFATLIEASGAEAADVPRALALALARYTGADVADAQRAVDAFGAADMLAAMALPPSERMPYLDALKCGDLRE